MTLTTVYYNGGMCSSCLAMTCLVLFVLQPPKQPLVTTILPCFYELGSRQHCAV